MPSDDASIALGTAVRRLMDASVLTNCDDTVVREAVAAVEEISDRLSASVRERMPWPDGGSMRRGARPFSPVIGPANPLAPPVSVHPQEDRSVLADITMRPIHEGPPGSLHGGWVGMLLDQILGHANAAAGVAGMTAELTVRYRRPTPYGVPLVIHARTESVDGRKVITTGEITAEGKVTAEARGLFIQPSPERVKQFTETASGAEIVE